MNLFTFEWLTGCANDYFVQYCKDNHLNYYYDMERICIDLYRIGTMFHFDYQHISGNTFQVIAKAVQ